ncbi:MAG: imidazolonepropionase [Coriobacteriia bacterium]|jgi:imidazolonepropionase|nr:imidazolonepropionase [Coriobacteriia bacterium]
MISTLITGIGELVTNDGSLGDKSVLGIMHDAALVLAEGKVAWVGSAHERKPATDERVNVKGRAVIPGFVDSHTHLVFAGERSAEFGARMAGEPYSGGGIVGTVLATRAATREQLRANTRRLVAEMHSYGTTTVEIKSGYGLSVADEVRMLEVAREFTDEATFLGAHAVPPEYAHDREGYVALVCGEMLESCAPHARWVDVFCEMGAFDEDESRAVLAAGASAGLMLRVHGNQLRQGPGVALALELGAASVDHCVYLSDDDIAGLAESDVVATLLPGTDFSGRGPYPPARALLDAGATVALATNCNPGSSYVTSMPFCLALAVREMRMTPAEALHCATAGGAAALRRDDVGRLAPGCAGDLAVLDGPSYLHLIYRPAGRVISSVWKNGQRVGGGGADGE